LFLSRLHASDALLRWLKDNDCESVYCRELDEKDVDGPAAVPEFQQAIAIGEKEYGTRALALKWLPTTLPDDIRFGFYTRQQTELLALIKQAEEASKVPVLSVTTDRNGLRISRMLSPARTFYRTLCHGIWRDHRVVELRCQREGRRPGD